VAVRLGTPLRLFWKIHRAFTRATGARFALFGAPPVLLLTTRGHRSGAPRGVALHYFRDGDDLVVIASYAGEDRDPAWWKNLKTHPQATVTIAGRTTRVRAYEAEGARRELLWDKAVERDPAYAEYQRRTKRRIPVVVLERVAGSS
jgi:F420H(2)-dependent quinone reductase